MPRSKPNTKPNALIRGYRERVHGDAVCLTAYVSPKLARSVRVRAAEQGRTISALVSAALEQAERSQGG